MILIEQDYPFLVIDFAGRILTAEDKALLAHPIVAGVVLFARNDQAPEGLQQLCQSIKAINPEIIIMVDQEGGKVQRLHEGCGALPTMYALGKGYESDPEACKDKVRRAAKECASYLHACGIDLNYAPVLDLHQERSEIIGQLGRAFHHDPNIISLLASIWIEEHHRQGVWVTGKHFPGHGCVVGDSHLTEVVDHRTAEEIKGQDMQPYQALKDHLDVIMTAHVIYPKCDKLTATLSPYWHRILREEVGYQGLVATDCLSMNGITGGYLENLESALSVGCDFVLMCNCREDVKSLLENEFKIKHHQALSRLKTKVK